MSAERTSQPPAGEAADALSEDELRKLDAEPLPNREAMSTLIFAPGPHAVPVEEVATALDESA